jgi:helicase
MRTSEYDWYRPDFSDYNVAQESVIPFCDEDMNLIVCFGTAVGKTVIAECAFGYHIANEGKVAYVSPYRSLCSEKFEKWSKDIYLNSGSIAIQTGEKRSNNRRLLNASLTILTTESFNGRTRTKSWKSWLEDGECLVIDEAHIIGDPTRGMAVEASLLWIMLLIWRNG